jgi:hypothetical protein
MRALAGPAVAPRWPIAAVAPTTLAECAPFGVTCTPRIAYLTLAIDGAIAEAPVERVEVAAQYESSEELLSTLDEIKRALGQLRPDLVVLLMPEQSRHKRTYQEIAPHVALETLVRIAAVQENIAIECCRDRPSGHGLASPGPETWLARRQGDRRAGRPLLDGRPRCCRPRRAGRAQGW